MRVPAEPERDSDLVIGSALKDNADLIAEVRRLREAGDALAEAVEGLKNISARAGGQAFATEAWERWQELRGTEAMEAGTR